MRTTLSGALFGTRASVSSVTRTSVPSRLSRCAMSSSAMPAGVAIDARGVQLHAAVEAFQDHRGPGIWPRHGFAYRGSASRSAHPTCSSSIDRIRATGAGGFEGPGTTRSGLRQSRFQCLVRNRMPTVDPAGTAGPAAGGSSALPNWTGSLLATSAGEHGGTHSTQFALRLLSCTPRPRTRGGVRCT